MARLSVQDLLNWYIRLFNEPGWRAYTRERVQQLAAECPELYGHFPDAMRRAFPSEAAE